MTVVGSRKESLLSIRLVWPFTRLAATDPQRSIRLSRAGIHAAELADPDTRISHRAVIELLAEAVQRNGDPTLGLRAGQLVEPGDFGALEHAARSSATIGEATSCMARYFRLMHDAMEITIVGEGDQVAWCFRVTDGVEQPPAANDYVLAVAITFVRRNTVNWEPPAELRLTHPEPSYAPEYERLFGAPARFGAPHNAIVVKASRLATPMAHANPRVSAAFERHARKQLDQLKEADGIAGRARQAIAEQLGRGAVTMHGTARRLAMSVATLRRRLEEEGTTYRVLVHELRRSLAERYLRDSVHAINEVAFLLGFSSVTAFNRAFRRWTGQAPTEFRARRRP